MDPRRKKAVILAALPASLTAVFVAMTPRVSGNHRYQVVLGLWLLVVLLCLCLAMREIIALKRDGNPY